MLIAELLRRGYTDEDIKKLAGRNILRVLRARAATARSAGKDCMSAEADHGHIVALGDSTTAGTPLFQSPIEAPPDGRGRRAQPVSRTG